MPVRPRPRSPAPPARRPGRRGAPTARPRPTASKTPEAEEDDRPAADATARTSRGRAATGRPKSDKAWSPAPGVREPVRRRAGADHRARGNRIVNVRALEMPDREARSDQLSAQVDGAAAATRRCRSRAPTSTPSPAPPRPATATRSRCGPRSSSGSDSSRRQRRPDLACAGSRSSWARRSASTSPTTCRCRPWRSCADEVFAWLREVDAPVQHLPRRQRGEPLRPRRGRARRRVRRPADVLDRCADLWGETDGYFDGYATGRLDPSGYVKGWSVQVASDRLLAAGRAQPLRQRRRRRAGARPVAGGPPVAGRHPAPVEREGDAATVVERHRPGRSPPPASTSAATT